MKPLKEFNIQFIGLKLGEHHFEYDIDKKFFDEFEFDEFNDASLKTNLVFNKKTTMEFCSRIFHYQRNHDHQL